MFEDRHAAKSEIGISFLLGGLVGAVLAVLFAPRSGRDTRHLIGETARERAERGRQLKKKAVEKGRAMVDEAKGYLGKARKRVDGEPVPGSPGSSTESTGANSYETRQAPRGPEGR